MPSNATSAGVNVYEFHQNPPLYVRAGDSLMIQHRGSSDANKILYYQEYNGPDNYLLTGNAITKIEDNAYPLLSPIVSGKTFLYHL